MSPRRRAAQEAPGPAGFLVVDKPAGVTSHDVVDAARDWFGTRRVGHLGTLDPLATGVLPLAVREATKLIRYLSDGVKIYRGAIRLGAETDTLDAEGKILSVHSGPLPTRDVVEAALEDFCGDIEQIPPMFSSVKHGGVPLHRLARKGLVVERQPRKVRIESIRLLGYEPPDVEIEVVCAPGTYVRVLAADLGAHMGCGGHLAYLRRTRSGAFDILKAASPETLAEESRSGVLLERLLAPSVALGLPVLTLNETEARCIADGGSIPTRPPAPTTPGSRATGLAPEQRLLAVLEVGMDRRLQPRRVLRLVAPQERL